MAFKKDYPSIGCYAQAARIYNETKPLRGGVARPIGRRSKGNPARIEKDGDYYYIWLYSTRVVTYCPDGSVVLHTGGWPTQATVQAMHAMSPYSCRLSRGRVIASCPEGSFVVDGELEFDRNGKPVHPPVAYKTKTLVNKEKAKQVREYYKDVAKYLKAFNAMGRESENPWWRGYHNLAQPLTDERAAQMALDIAGCPVDEFWAGVYEEQGVRETVQIALPYGQVD